MLVDLAKVLTVFGIPMGIVGSLFLFFRAIGEKATVWIMTACFAGGFALFYGILLFKIGQALWRRYRPER